MGAALGHLTLAEHEDAICILDGCQPVRNHHGGHGGLCLDQLLQRLLHDAFAAEVQGAGSLVQQQNGRISNHASRNGDALFLSSAQLRSMCPDIGLVA
eukprot:CAMPEP_0183524932 /NCGR_PEP_ID=MMETSP0371-20130417/20268_1 /TAXON_ID=268820 /ORGANISM="Peridinium aciculiferum, Strain PAER-2" /LENGTH=97 /DNA_ID=CAMNT_0025724107 /DNA_START=222 /DNA_END=515 /DNA_ORIENTATION=-